ncbi:MAG TPA: VWA domain-containing protein [Solirubrobacterales bacterium]|nr:VWA domain-containing protein [Solirubrobacterales bacterium]
MRFGPHLVDTVQGNGATRFGMLIRALLLAGAIFMAMGIVGAASASADGTLIVTKGGDRSASANVSGATTYASPVQGAVFEYTTGDPTSPATTWTALPATAANGQASATLAAGTYYVREKTGGTGFSNFGPVQSLSFNGSQPYVARVTIQNNQTTYAFPHSNTSGTPANWTPTNSGSATNNGSPFINVRDNDTLPPGCGTNILLVLDRSGSIDPFKDEYEEAAKEFVSELNGTPTQIGITSFNSSVNSYQPAVGDSDFYHSPLDLSVAGSAATLNSTIENIYSAPEDLTNWDGALKAASQAKGFTANASTGQTTNPDMVVFITDGNPTTSEVNTSGSNEDLINLTSGMASANLVKNQTGRAGKKLKMLAIGVGNGVTIDNLKAVSGPVEGVDGDYAAPTIPELQSFLSELAASQCGARVFVRKRITGDNANKPNWFYTATDPRPGKTPTYQDGNRATHSSGAPPVIETGAFFNQLPSTPTTVNVNEDAAGQPLTNFDLTSVVCRKDSYDNGTLVNGQQSGLNYSLPVNRGDSIYCTYTNTPKTTLSVTKTPDNSTINAGDDAEFTIAVKNTGTAAAMNAALNDALPAPGVGGWTISQQPGGNPCSIAGNNLSCAFGSIAAGDTVTVKVKTGTSFNACGVYDNPTATASAANAPNASDGGKITCQKPNLSVTKSGNGPVNAGDDVEFTMQVSNAGPGVARSATLNDPLPSGVAGSWTISQQPGGSPCSIAANTLNCNFGDLASGASVTVKVKAATNNANCAVYDNTVTAAATNSPNATAGASITCRKPSLGTLKTSVQGTISAGDTAAFSITVSNAGPGTAKAVTLSDPLPSGVSGAWTIDTQPGGNPCSIAANTLSCNFGDLAAGASVTVTIKAPTNFQNCTTLDNTATASATNAPNASDDATITCNKPNLSVVKTGNGPVSAGSDVEFTVQVSNAGPGTARSVTLNDPLPSGTAAAWSISSQPGGNPCSIAGNTLSCSFGDLAPAASATVKVKAPTSNQACTTYDNTATASSTNSPNATDDASIVCNKPNLSVVKTGNGPVSAGEDIEYTLQVSNAGPGTAGSVSLTDPLPAGTAGTWTISSQPGGNPCSITAGNLNCAFGDLAPGASVTVKVKAATSGQACTTYDNTATATSSNTPNASDDATITCNKPNLSVVKTGNGPVNAGEDVAFTIQTSNAGPGTAKAVKLSDPLPGGTASVWTIDTQPGGNPCSITAGTLNCDFGDLASGASASVKVKAATSGQACTTYDNTATASSTNAPNASDDAMITCNKPNLSVMKTGNGPLNAGDDAEYTIQVSNGGPGTAKAVKLNDPLPSGTAATWSISSQPGGNPCSIVADTLSCDFGDLASGASASVTVKAPTSDDACKVYDNTATASSANAPDASDEASITCNRAGLGVLKTAVQGTISAGDTAEFSIKVSNTGDGTAKAVKLSDPLPSGVSGSWTIDTQPAGDPCSITAGTLNCAFGDLASGASVTVTVKAATDFENCATLDNTATASATNAPDASDDASINCQKPDLSVTKTGNGPVNAGENVEFTIDVKNAGPGTAKAVKLSDPLPSGTASAWSISSQPGGNPCSITAGTLECDFGDLASGSSVTVKVSAPTSDEACTVYDNTATATSTNSPDASDDASITCNRAGLGVLKTAVQGTISAGDTASFSIKVSNTGDGTAKGVTLSDPLPSGVSGSWAIDTQPAGDPCSISAGTLNCAFGDLASGASVTVTVKAATDFENCATLDNTATASATNAPDASDDASINCQKPDLSVTKTGNGPVSAGDDVEFSIDVKNAGPGTAKAVKLSDPLPAGTAAAWSISSQPGGDPCAITGDTLNCDFGDLASGSTATVKVSAPTSSEDCTVYDNTATATSANAPDASDDASVECQAPDLTITKTAGAERVIAGQNVSFTIDVGSNGPGTAKDVTLNDPLPAGTAGGWSITDQPDGDPCSIVANTLTCDFGDMAPDASASVTITAGTSVPFCAVYDNTATASASNHSDVTAQATTRCEQQVVNPTPDLSITKTGNGPIQSGQDAKFTILVSNAGPGNAAGVTLSDPLPGGTAGPWTIESQPVGSPCSITDGTLNCTFALILASDSRTVTIKAPTNVDNCALYENTATVDSPNTNPITGSGSVDCIPVCPNLQNATGKSRTSARTSALCPEPNIELKKTANKRKVFPGEKVKYEIGIRNTKKNSVARNLKICDRLPGQMSVTNKGSGFFDNGKLCWFVKALPFSKNWKTFRYVARVDSDAAPGSKLKNVVVVGKKKAHHTVHVKRPQEVGAATKHTPVTG